MFVLEVLGRIPDEFEHATVLVEVGRGHRVAHARPVVSESAGSLRRRLSTDLCCALLAYVFASFGGSVRIGALVVVHGRSAQLCARVVLLFVTRLLLQSEGVIQSL